MIPSNYIDHPPDDLSEVSRCHILIRSIMQERTQEFEEFLEGVTSSVYNVLDELVNEMECAVSEEWRESVRESEWYRADAEARQWVDEVVHTIQGGDEEVIGTRRDLEYLLKMKAMDEEIRRKREEEREKEREGRREGEGEAIGEKEGERGGGRLEMTEVVPIAGLVMARFHLYDCELRTVLEIWGRKVPNLGTVSLVQVKMEDLTSEEAKETFALDERVSSDDSSSSRSQRLDGSNSFSFLEFLFREEDTPHVDAHPYPFIRQILMESQDVPKPCLEIMYQTSVRNLRRSIHLADQEAESSMMLASVIASKGILDKSGNEVSCASDEDKVDVEGDKYESKGESVKVDEEGETWGRGKVKEIDEEVYIESEQRVSVEGLSVTFPIPSSPPPLSLSSSSPRSFFTLFSDRYFGDKTRKAERNGKDSPTPHLTSLLSPSNSPPSHLSIPSSPPLSPPIPITSSPHHPSSPPPFLSTSPTNHISFAMDTKSKKEKKVIVSAAKGSLILAKGTEKDYDSKKVRSLSHTNSHRIDLNEKEVGKAPFSPLDLDRNTKFDTHRSIIDRDDMSHGPLVSNLTLDLASLRANTTICPSCQQITCHDADFDERNEEECDWVERERSKEKGQLEGEEKAKSNSSLSRFRTKMLGKHLLRLPNTTAQPSSPSSSSLSSSTTSATSSPTPSSLAVLCPSSLSSPTSSSPRTSGLSTMESSSSRPCDN